MLLRMLPKLYSLNLKSTYFSSFCVLKSGLIVIHVILRLIEKMPTVRSLQDVSMN